MLDDFSRYIVAWKLCTTMKAEDVTATLERALKSSGLDQASSLNDRGCYRTTDRATSPPTWPNGLTTRTWITFAERLTTR